jgi:hypothetical protein
LDAAKSSFLPVRACSNADCSVYHHSGIPNLVFGGREKTLHPVMFSSLGCRIVCLIEIVAWRWVMNAKDETGKVNYFGIEVEILVRLNHCCLVRYQGRELIVDTADLISRQTFAQAA